MPALGIAPPNEPSTPSTPVTETGGDQHQQFAQGPADARRKGVDTTAVEGLLRTVKLAAEVPWFGDEDKKSTVRVVQYARRLRTYWKTTPQGEEVIRARLVDAFRQLGARYFCYGPTEEMLANLEDFEVEAAPTVAELVAEMRAHPPRRPEDGVRAVCAYFGHEHPRAPISEVTDALYDLSGQDDSCRPLLNAIAERVRELFADVIRPGEMPSVHLAGGALEELIGLLGPHIYQCLPYRNKEEEEDKARARAGRRVVSSGSDTGRATDSANASTSSANAAASSSNTGASANTASTNTTNSNTTGTTGTTTKKRTRRSRRSKEPVVIKDENPFPYPGTKRWGLSCVFCGNDDPPHRPKNCPVARLAAEKGVVRYDSKVPGWLESQTGMYLPRPPRNNIADQDIFPVEVRKFTASYAHAQGWASLDKPEIADDDDDGPTPADAADGSSPKRRSGHHDSDDDSSDDDDDDSANATWYEQLPKGTMGRLADVIHQEVFRTGELDN